MTSLCQSEMKKLLLAACDEYYNNSNSVMTDQEFDELKDQYAKMFPDDEFLKQIGAPVSAVSEWKKATHKIAMSSLNKVNLESEFLKWVSSIGSDSYIIEEKLDGISIAINYNQGKLESAITRGDSLIGEIITSNVIKMKNVKKIIPNFTGSIRGEIVLFNSDLEKLNTELRNKGLKEFKNARNAASGIAKKYDGTNSEYLTILYYDVTGDWFSEEDKMKWLESQGLKTSYWKPVTANECVEVYNDYENMLRAKCDWNIDGLVIKLNDINKQKQLGELNGNPKGQIAWKFTSMKAETEILDIEWHRGNGTHITPVAVLKPVKLCGVTIQRASLHNLKIFNELRPYKNARVLISRHGDVIPGIDKIIE